jgi:hypothetical protein
MLMGFALIDTACVPRQMVARCCQDCGGAGTKPALSRDFCCPAHGVALRVTFALLVLGLSILAAAQGLCLAVPLSSPSPAFAVGTVALYVVAFTICIHAVVNRVRDVERGYSPGRCSLAAVIRLFTFVLSLWLGLSWVSFTLRSPALAKAPFEALGRAAISRITQAKLRQ